jgi:acid phosphatase
VRCRALLTARRSVLATAVAAGGLALGAGPATASGRAGRAAQKLAKVDHVVVIYQENHSFDNLYGGWEDVNGLASADPAHTIQVNQAGAPFACLKQNDPSLTSPPLSVTCSDPANGIDSHFANAPFGIDAFIPPAAAICPNGTPGGAPGGCTRDLVHRYYQEQYQLDGGRQDRYVTGSDAIGLTMGTYDTTQLPIYRYLHGRAHPDYAVADNFFQGAFGGSFLNHQWLVAGATPTFPGALNDGSANDLHAVVDANGMPASYPLYTSPLGSAVKDPGLTASCSPPAGRPPTPAGVKCGDYAVNTIQPAFQPFAPGTAAARRLPPQHAATIGDELIAAGVDWAWYAGGWSNANGDVDGPGWTNGHGPTTCSDPATIAGASFPDCANSLFQFHHQPFNYFAAYAPGTAARDQHLRDEEEFVAQAKSSTHTCNLKAVSFVKPIGAENEHPGYTNVTRGSGHLVDLLQAIDTSRCAKDTMVVVTYDEFGGSWDHVPPPGQGNDGGPHDVWGPGSRVPALILAPHLRDGFVVDHTEHDTTSVLATIERRFGLPALGSRDAAVPDLSSVFTAREAQTVSYRPGQLHR